MTEINDKLVKFFVSKEDVRVIKTSGDPIIIIGDSLNIFEDPITGIARNGAYIEINISEIKDIVAA